MGVRLDSQEPTENKCNESKKKMLTISGLAIAVGNLTFFSQGSMNDWREMLKTYQHQSEMFPVLYLKASKIIEKGVTLSSGDSVFNVNSTYYLISFLIMCLYVFHTWRRVELSMQYVLEPLTTSSQLMSFYIQKAEGVHPRRVQA